jgi:hypothetical protein
MGPVPTIRIVLGRLAVPFIDLFIKFFRSDINLACHLNATNIIDLLVIWQDNIPNDVSLYALVQKKVLDNALWVLIVYLIPEKVIHPYLLV